VSYSGYAKTNQQTAEEQSYRMGHRPAFELSAESGNQKAGKKTREQNTRRQTNRRGSLLIEDGATRYRLYSGQPEDQPRRSSAQTLEFFNGSVCI
jgi:hypothetical protein